MIRIVDAENRKSASLSNEQKAVFQLLGIVVADQSAELIRLLKKYGVAISSNATNLQIINAVVNAIEVGDKNFNQELAEIFEEQVIPDDYDSFNANELFEHEVANYDNFTTTFKRLASQLKKIKNWLKGNKKAKTQAKGEAMKSSMEFQEQKDQSSKKEKEKLKKNKVIKIAAATTIVAAVIGLMIWKVNKGKTSQIKLT